MVTLRSGSRLVLSLALWISASGVAAQPFCTVNPDDTGAVNKWREQQAAKYLSCFPPGAAGPADKWWEGKAAEMAPCNMFVAHFLEDHGVTKMRATNKQGEPALYLLANQLAERFKDGDFEFFGEATSQPNLDKAATAANQGRLVVAVRPEAGASGHVALIIAGPLRISGRWSNLKTPNAASFFIGHPEEAFAGCALSYAFRDPKGVLLYAYQR